MPIGARAQPAVDEIDALPPDDEGARLSALVQDGGHALELRAIRRDLGREDDEPLAGGDALRPERDVVAERQRLLMRERMGEDRNARALGAQYDETGHAEESVAWAMG